MKVTIATLTSSVWRARSQRRAYAHTLKSMLSLQHHIREWLGRRQHHAAVTIVVFWRYRMNCANLYRLYRGLCQAREENRQLKGITIPLLRGEKRQLWNTVKRVRDALSASVDENARLSSQVQLLHKFIEDPVAFHIMAQKLVRGYLGRLRYDRIQRTAPVIVVQKLVRCYLGRLRYQRAQKDKTELQERLQAQVQEMITQREWNRNQKYAFVGACGALPVYGSSIMAHIPCVMAEAEEYLGIFQPEDIQANEPLRLLNTVAYMRGTLTENFNAMMELNGLSIATVTAEEVSGYVPVLGVICATSCQIWYQQRLMDVTRDAVVVHAQNSLQRQVTGCGM
jgi:hypothetical protein